MALTVTVRSSSAEIMFSKRSTPILPSPGMAWECRHRCTHKVQEAPCLARCHRDHVANDDITLLLASAQSSVRQTDWEYLLIEGDRAHGKYNLSSIALFGQQSLYSCFT